MTIYFQETFNKQLNKISESLSNSFDVTHLRNIAVSFHIICYNVPSSFTKCYLALRAPRCTLNLNKLSQIGLVPAAQVFFYPISIWLPPASVIFPSNDLHSASKSAAFPSKMCVLQGRISMCLKKFSHMNLKLKVIQLYDKSTRSLAVSLLVHRLSSINSAKNAKSTSLSSSTKSAASIRFRIRIYIYITLTQTLTLTYYISLETL